VVPREMAPPADVGQFVESVDKLIIDQGFATVGSRIVIAAGSSLGTPALLNGIVIHTVGQAWGAGQERAEFPRLASGMDRL
jgi:hypothetical protein